MKRNLSFITLIPAGLALSLFAAACGQIKDRDEAVVVVGGSRQQQNAGQEDGEELIRRLKDVYDLYADADGLTQEQLRNLLARYPGTSGSPGLADALFLFDGDSNRKLTLAEIADGISNRVPTLRWIAKDESVDRESLVQRIRLAHPTASVAAAEGVAQALMEFDRPQAGGDGDGKIRRREVTLAGVLMAAALSRGVPVAGRAAEGASADERVQAELVAMKLDQQVFGRYLPSVRLQELPEEDQRLEWMQLLARFNWSEKLLRTLNGKVPLDGQVPLLTAIGLGSVLSASPDSWMRVRSIHDNPLLGGNGDGALNRTELFDFLSQITYSQALLQRAGAPLDVTLLRSRPELLASLTLLGRATATDLFQDPALTPAGPREAYWSTILRFDAIKRGGNASGSLDAPELAYALAYGRILEVVFALGDKNRDGKIQQAEASDVLQLFDIDDPDAVAFFFSEAGTQWNGIPNFTPSGPVQSELGPWEFYRRLENILDANLG